MFSWFKKKVSAGKGDTDAVISRMDGKELTYVTERMRDEDGNVTEIVIGKGGRVSTHTDLVTVVCDGTPVFTCYKSDAVCSDLMSLAGVIIQGVDRDLGLERTIVAYFQYHRR